MENLIVAGILIVLIGTIVFYLVREKKKGRKCIGCPYAKQCSGHYNGGCGGNRSGDRCDDCGGDCNHR